MPRTTHRLVSELLGDDYDSTSSLTPFVATASVIVTRVVTCASAKGLGLGSDEAELLERWLAAHFYVQRDQPYQTKNTGKSQATFQGSVGMGIEGSKYGLTALRLDYSGCLSAIDKRKFAGGFWNGKTQSEALSYDQRNGGTNAGP